MKAAVLTEYGVPRLEDFAEPTAGAGQEVVQVTAATINAVDKEIAAGTHYFRPRTLPVVCGIEGVGMADGRRVYFSMPAAPYGSMAERTVVDPQQTLPVPDGLDDAVAATLGNAGRAAWLPLSWQAALRPGERVLILGATGVVGRLAVQAARLLMRSKGASIHGFMPIYAGLELIAASYAEMADHVLAGRLIVEVERWPLTEVEAAWHHQARRKLVLIP
jgi:NADPH2:quinone reductase